MKRLFSIASIALAAALVCSSLGAGRAGAEFTVGNPDTSDWFVWEMPDDELAMGTAIDASFFLDAPAGKHGFAQAVGEDIVFEDGERIRLWGTNVVMQANFMTKPELEKLADRIARTGFNIVRFHHLDINRADNIFGEGPISTTRQLDPVQLDKVHYFMSLLKERGIYFYMDLLVMRPGDIPADGIIDGDTLGLGWKATSVFAPNLIELQKEYAEQLFTAPNPYILDENGDPVPLKDEPALIAVQIHNENSIFQISANEITSPYYLGIFTQLFNDWLKNKYATREELEAAWHEPGKVGLEPHEDFNDGTVNIIGNGSAQLPNWYDTLNYSSARKRDIYEFNYDTVYAFYEDFRDFLRNEVGVKSLITGNAMGGPSNKRAATVHLSQELMDFTDNHSYKSHPNPNIFGPGGSLTSWTSSTIASGGELHRSTPWLRGYNQPYILSEWQVTSPGPHAAEGVLVQAAVASLQNWNLLQFDMLHTATLPQNGDPIDKYFVTYSSADHTSIQPAAAMIFHRGDVREAEGAYYPIYDKSDVLDEKVYRSAYLLGFENAWMYAKVGMAAREKLDSGDLMTPEALEEAMQMYKRNEPGPDIHWNKRMGIFRIDTEYTNAATGYIGDKTISLSYADILVENPTATISFNSVSHDTLQDAERVLLTAISRARNTGLVMDDDNMKIMNAGTGPMMMEPITAGFVIKTTDEIAVYALDSSGQRKEQLPVAKTPEGYSRFSIGKPYQTVHYEIVKQD